MLEFGTVSLPLLKTSVADVPFTLKMWMISNSPTHSLLAASPLRYLGPWQTWLNVYVVNCTRIRILYDAFPFPGAHDMGASNVSMHDDTFLSLVGRAWLLLRVEAFHQRGITHFGSLV